MEICRLKLVQLFYGLRSKRCRRPFVRRCPATAGRGSSDNKFCHFVSVFGHWNWSSNPQLTCFASAHSPLLPSHLGHLTNSGFGSVHPSLSPPQFRKAPVTTYPSTTLTSTNAFIKQTHSKLAADSTLSPWAWRWSRASWLVAQKRWFRRSQETPMPLLHRSISLMRLQRKRDRTMPMMYDRICRLFTLSCPFFASWVWASSSFNSGLRRTRSNFDGFKLYTMLPL